MRGGALISGRYFIYAKRKYSFLVRSRLMAMGYQLCLCGMAMSKGVDSSYMFAARQLLSKPTALFVGRPAHQPSSLPRSLDPGRRHDNHGPAPALYQRYGVANQQGAVYLNRHGASSDSGGMRRCGQPRVDRIRLHECLVVG